MSQRILSILLSILLWLAAIAIGGAIMGYQSSTGPTKPCRGSVDLGGEALEYELPRTKESTTDARVAVPAASAELAGTLVYRRYPTQDPFTRIPLAREGDELSAALPKQPAAAKLEYHLELRLGESRARIPAEADEHIVIRFKDPVPPFVLVPHIAMMILSILLGVRTLLGALFAPRGMRRLAWWTLGALTVGGMILGPIVQKYAFGEFWAGYPNGKDLTDNKTLIMWGVWLLACLLIGRKERRREGLARGLVVAASVVMLAVYAIPHSLRGSELDWKKVDEGVAPEEAIETGD